MAFNVLDPIYLTVLRGLQKMMLHPIAELQDTSARWLLSLRHFGPKAINDMSIPDITRLIRAKIWC